MKKGRAGECRKVPPVILAGRRKRRAAAALAAGVAAAVLGRRRLRVGGPGRAAAPPLPPPLPPGRLVVLPGRGEVLARDTGPRDGAMPVLLLHGWTATADVNFFAVYGPLAEQRRVIALDHRGHGRGMRSATFSLEDCADDAAALLDVLSVPEVLVVGYSMGGPIAMLLAQRHPAKVAGLVLQATALEWSGEWWERLRWRGLALLELSLRMGTGESAVNRLLSDATRRNPDIEPIREWLASEFRRGEPGSIADAGRAIASYDARPWAGHLGIPAAAVVTTKDDLVPPGKQRALADALGAQVFELRGRHDVPVVNGPGYAQATCAAVTWVSEGLAAPRKSPAAARAGRGR